MEGVRCCHPDCRVHDYLPFYCPRCERAFCLAHRSRFVHPCVSDEVHEEEESPIGPQSTRNAYREHMDRVSARHAATDAHFTTAAPPKTHWRIKSDPHCLPVLTDDFRGFYARLQALESSSSTPSSSLVEREREKQRRVARKTRALLVKQRAVGAASLSPAERHYLVLHFDPQTLSNPQIDSVEKAFVFVRKNALLGDVLDAFLENPKFARLLRIDAEFAGSERERAGLRCVLKTRDSPQWRDWNRAACVGALCESCEDVFLSLAPAEEVRAAQERVCEVVRRQRVALAEIERETQRETEKERDNAVPRVFRKGERAWYHKTPYTHTPHNSLSQVLAAGGSVLLVTVEGVHFDDIAQGAYYTVRPARESERVAERETEGRGPLWHALRFADEKQTDDAHLVSLTTQPAHTTPSSAVSAHTTPSQTAHTSVPTAALSQVEEEMRRLGDAITVRVTHGKNSHTLSASLHAPLALFTQLVSAHTGVPPQRQKLLFKGRVLKSEPRSPSTLQSLGVTDGARISMMG